MHASPSDVFSERYCPISGATPQTSRTLRLLHGNGIVPTMRRTGSWPGPSRSPPRLWLVPRARPPAPNVFEGYGPCHDGHGAQVHDTDHQQNRRESGAAMAALKTDSQSISPRRGGAVGYGSAATLRQLSAVGQAIRLPPRELQSTATQDDQPRERGSSFRQGR